MRRLNFSGLFKKKADLPEKDAANARLNLGCGGMYMPGWFNIDIDPAVKADITCDFLSLDEHFRSASVQEILMLHSISYLRLWEARIFFRKVFGLLRDKGMLVMEFPDIVKCARVIDSTEDIDKYIEGVRGVYAFDLGQIKRHDKFTPYAFGWSAWHIKKELSDAGFTEVKIEDPETHDRRTWRDTRVTARK